MMTFSEALIHMKEGGRAAREGWNGKGMYVCIQRGYMGGIPINRNTAEATGLPEGSVQKFRPYFMMKTVEGHFVPWTISHTDALSDDWVEV